MSWEPFLFMIFSTCETFALYFLIMSMFRFKWERHAWQALFVILLLNLQSYLLRNELDAGNFSSLVLIVILIIFFTAVVKMPIFLSIIATVSGFIIFALIQMVLILTMFGSLTVVDNSAQKGYLLQFITALFIIPIFRYLYVKGKGFTFDIEKLRLKFDDIFLTVLVILFLLGLSLLLYFKEIYLHILFFVPILAFLIFYSKRKENEDDR
ncbi:hypothetical protein [Paenibacillus graminis]|uniref:hypothetical protein n=1 Tax=Paenibacillus graminis TaxID=189425 RepID=UPI002DBCE826|nr:hypothetical protein [Paenibacillus graminis]MEC0168142.1 hypothetical protein [Paenibacillus graminis]